MPAKNIIVELQEYFDLPWMVSLLPQDDLRGSLNQGSLICSRCFALLQRTSVYSKKLPRRFGQFVLRRNCSELSSIEIASSQSVSGKFLMSSHLVFFFHPYVVYQLGAGKVHGSLARAGKVRGQTPKVAKQDKKKNPRGHAHKKMQ